MGTETKVEFLIVIETQDSPKCLLKYLAFFFFKLSFDE